jgi:hypothetical protein
MDHWHVYEDWTLEAKPRCFYVGKGDDDRVAKLKRTNERHAEIVSKLGQRRVIVATGPDELAILNAEKRVIAERHTYVKDPNYNGIGCNRTRGGQGNSGRVVSEATGQKISAAKRGKTPNKAWTQAERDATSARMSLLHKGKKLSKEHIDVLRVRMADPSIKQDMIDKVTASINAKYENDHEFRQHIKETRVKGVKHPSARFTEQEVFQMRTEWAALDTSVRGATRQFCERWAVSHNVSTMAVYGIVTRKTWRHLP